MARDAAIQVVNWLAAKIRTLERRISELEHDLPKRAEVRAPLRASAPTFCPRLQLVLAELLPPAAEHEEPKELDVVAEHLKLPREEPAPEEQEPAAELQELRELGVAAEHPGLPQKQTAPEEQEPAAKLEEPRELEAAAERQAPRREHAVLEAEPSAEHEEPKGLDVAAEHQKLPREEPAPGEQEPAAEQEEELEQEEAGFFYDLIRDDAVLPPGLANIGDLAFFELHHDVVSLAKRMVLSTGEEVSDKWLARMGWETACEYWIRKDLQSNVVLASRETRDLVINLFAEATCMAYASLAERLGGRLGGRRARCESSAQRGPEQRDRCESSAQRRPARGA